MAELAATDRAEARARRARSLELRSAGALPHLGLTEPTLFVWDQETDGAEQWIVIRLAGSGDEIWRELAYYEGWPRCETVRRLLSRRYGHNFAGLLVTRRSLTHLYGDDVAAADKLGRPRLAGETEAPWLAAGEATRA